MKRILLPFSWLYNLVTRFRNHLYDIGYRKSFHFDGIFTISVGNLNMGGSGKTPVTEYLIRLLAGQYSIAALSRGYGRRTRGFRILDAADGAETGGDEPVQIKRKFGAGIKVVVSEDRSLAIPELLNSDHAPEVIIMDDAFQHRRVTPDLSILLTRFSEPFFKDRIFPAGWLREARSGAKRADLVMFTKCPEGLSLAQMDDYAQRARGYSGDLPVFFTDYRYCDPISFGNQTAIGKKVLLVTGIANSGFMLDYIRRTYSVVRHIRLPDHHRFQRKEIDSIIQSAGQEGSSLLTTEKDMVRLVSPEFERAIANAPWFYLPVEIRFLRDREEFDKLVLDKLNQTIHDAS
ncbi:MAG: tetraacyldisaccharide 4'-kinase [Bacteroidota bacterium]